MTSMKEIAAECGVSIATVSKALNGQKDIGEETRDRICRTAKALGYLPNAQARALKTNRTRSLGVLFFNEGFTHEYYALLLESFRTAAEERGYNITFINGSQTGRENRSVLEHCLYRGFDGVVAVCMDFQDRQLVELLQSDLPVVTVDYVFDSRISVSSDNIGGIRRLLEYVYEKGHRKIAYIHGDMKKFPTRIRLASFYRTAGELGLTVPDEYVREIPYRDPARAGETTRQLLDLKAPPTCILYPDDLACLGGMKRITEMGLRIPEDISVAGFDGIPAARFVPPPLTTVMRNPQEIGRTAAEKLMLLIEDPRMTLIEPVTVRADLFPGETVAAPRWT